MDIQKFKDNKLLNIKVVTLSDRASKGEYEDKSGEIIVSKLKDYFLEKTWKFDISKTIIPDDEEDLREILSNLEKNKIDVLFTTGGTGIGFRDITVDVVKPILTKEIPGIMELIRVKYGMELPNAVLSRGVAGYFNDTLIFTLPGSVKAVNSYMHEILKTLEHIIFMRYGIDAHHKH